MGHKYRLSYKFKLHGSEGITKEEALKLSEDGWGSCDAFGFLGVSVIFPEDGSYSLHLVSVDGRTDGAELSDEELFKIWTLLSKRLTESRTLSHGKKEFARGVWETVWNFLGIPRKDENAIH